MGEEKEKRQESFSVEHRDGIQRRPLSRERRLNNACKNSFDLNLYYSLTNFWVTQQISVYPTSVHPKIARRRELIALRTNIQGTVCHKRTVKVKP